MGRIGRGLEKAAGIPSLLLLLWLTNLLAAVPLTLGVGAALDRSFGESQVADRMAAGFDSDWYAEHQVSAEGLVETFTPAVSGKGALLEVLEVWGSGELFHQTPEIVAAGMLYGLLWAFLSGGLLARLALEGEEGFAASCARFFGRFLLLVILSGGFYALVFWAVRRLYGQIESWSYEAGAETPVFLAVLATTLLGWAALHSIRLVFDLARVAVVVEDRSNVLRALAEALALFLRRPLATVGTYLGFGLLVLLWMSLYAAVAPTAGPATWTATILAFLGFQIYRLGRLFLRAGWLTSAIEVWREARSMGKTDPAVGSFSATAG